MRIKWARSATKHRVSREQSRYVVEHCGLVFREPPPANQAGGERLVYLGDDPAGIACEVLAVELADDTLLVIHAMPMRPRYRRQYGEAKAWRK